MPRVALARYGALGNDFLVLEGPLPSPGEVRRLCDRRAGVGADGLIALEGDRATLRNADGSPAGFSGNGVRCAGLHRAPEGGAVEIHLGDRAYAMQVGAAGPEAPEVPVELEVPAPARVLEPWRPEGALPENCQEAWRVDVGNPHLVLVAPPEAPAPAARLEALRGGVPGHPDGVNVTWLHRLGPSEARARTWERGVGPTPACASAAMACFLVLREAAEGEGPLTLQMPGGSLTLAGTRDLLRLGSPVRRILTGWWYP